MEYLKNLGSNVRLYREAQSLTQEDVTMDTQLNKHYLSRLENGQSEPTYSNLQKVAARLGVSIAELELAEDRCGVPFLAPENMASAWSTNYVPLYTIRAACGQFGDGEEAETLGYVYYDPRNERRHREDLFAVEARGHSMEPKIPDGSLCLFRRYYGGSREGLIVLAQHHDYYDEDNAGAFSIKRYHGIKQYVAGTDREQNTEVHLEPLNKDYEPIIITSDEGYRILAEFVCVLGR